jgi:hypothetical protein
MEVPLHICGATLVVVVCTSALKVKLPVCTILDPRLKMVSIKFIYGRLYSRDELESRIKEMIDKLRVVYDMYTKKYFSSSGAATLAFIELTFILF